MIAKPLFAIALALFLALFPLLQGGPALAAYVPHSGDSFSYYEVENLGNGTGSYAGYSEQTVINGTETMNGISGDGVVSAYYAYSWSWSNSTGGTQAGSSSGNFTFSSASFLYVNGTDDQTGYVNPTVWFYMNSSLQKGGTFYLLDTEMTVMSTDYGYRLPSEGRKVEAIFAQGTSSYPRDDEYGQFTATYTWSAYFDPSTGYIIGYLYVEHDTNPSGDGFTYTDDLYVSSTSYQLMTAVATGATGGDSGLTQNLGYIAGIALIIAVIAVVAYVLSRRRRGALPKHPGQQMPRGSEGYPPQTPPRGPAQDIDLTPKQPPVQQIVIKEVVKVKCRYCGALIDSTAETCPFCGAPRT